MSGFHSKIARRAAAALGLATITATGLAAYEELAERGSAYTSEVAAQTAPHTSEITEFDNGHLEWAAQSDGEVFPAATMTIPTENGPVKFQFNQADKISQRSFDPGAIPFIKNSVVNEWDRDSITYMATQIDAVAATNVGQGLFQQIAGDLSGEVQISKQREDRALATARGMTEVGWDLSTEIQRDKTHDVVRIALQEKLTTGTAPWTGDLAADGSLSHPSIGQVFVHELTHATYEHINAIHVPEHDGYIPAYNSDGSVKDLAMHVANQYGRELRGEDPDQMSSGDLILYGDADFRLQESDPFSSTDIEEARIRAGLEKYGYMQSPGMQADAILSPAVSGLSGLRMNEADFALHSQALARDAISLSSGQDHLDSLGRAPVLADASAWLEEKGGAQSDDPQVRRANHEVESAQRISAHRQAMQGLSIDGASALDTRIDAAAHHDPEQAIALFEGAISPDAQSPSIAAARDIANPNGIYGQTKSFLATHDAERRKYALNEAVHKLERNGLPDSGLNSMMRSKELDSERFFKQGRPTSEVQQDALSLISQTNTMQTALNQTQQNEPRRRSSARSGDQER